jgi:ketosteroid isomerase-like protein
MVASMAGSAKGDQRLARVREGFAALARGELGVVERVFAEDVRWTGLPPGPGDCLSRREVRQMLAGRVAEGALGPAEVLPVDARRVAVVSRRDGVELVHVLTFAGDRVVAVQACRDRAGIRALPPAEAPGAGDGSRPDDSCRPRA